MTWELKKGLFVFLAVFWGVPIMFWLHTFRPSAMLRSRVYNNLDFAAQNGYFEPGEHCHDMTADEIAYDLACYAADLDDRRPEELTPHVRRWLKKRGLT